MNNAKIPGSAAITRMGLIISLGSFVLAYTSVCLTNIANLLKLKNNLTSQELIFQLSVTTSCFNVGTVLSPILYRKYLKIVGQLNGITIIDVFGIIIMGVQLSQLNFWILCVCRFLLGLLIGLNMSIAPGYINSIAPPQIYARIGCYAQVVQTIGVSIAYSMSYMLNPNDESDQVLWRIYMGLPILAFLFRTILLRTFYPFDSLERHILRSQTSKINQYCLMTYHDQSQQLLNQVILTKSSNKISISNKNTWRRRFIVAIVVIASNQLSGINGILFYAKQLFNKITHDNQSYTQTLMVLLSVLQIMATLVSSEVADKKGRRPMLLGGQISIAIILFSVWLFDTVITIDNVSQIVIIVLIFLHVLIMNFTLGSLCIVYCAEIVQDITWIIITIKVCSLTVALTTDYMIQYLGIGQMFLIFFVLTMIAFLFLRTRLLETKGLATPQIYALFGKKQQQKPQNKQDVSYQQINSDQADRQKILITNQVLQNQYQQCGSNISSSVEGDSKRIQ